jgi:hypothetical protein
LRCISEYEEKREENERGKAPHWVDVQLLSFLPMKGTFQESREKGKRKRDKKTDEKEKDKKEEKEKEKIPLVVHIHTLLLDMLRKFR